MANTLIRCNICGISHEEPWHQHPCNAVKHAPLSLELQDTIGELMEIEQRRVIVLDLLWKLARKDYHGVADCAMDLRELHL